MHTSDVGLANRKDLDGRWEQVPWTQYIPLLAEQISLPHWHNVVFVFSAVPSLLEHATAAEHVSTVLWQNKLEEHVWVPQMQLAGLETVPSLLLHGRNGEHVLVLAVQTRPVVTVQSCIPQVQSSVFLIAPVVSWHATIDGGALQTHLFSYEQATEEAAVLNVYSEVPDQCIELSM